MVRDRHSGECKGFGFVRMGSEQAAATALQALDNYLIGEHEGPVEANTQSTSPTASFMLFVRLSRALARLLCVRLDSRCVSD